MISKLFLNKLYNDKSALKHEINTANTGASTKGSISIIRIVCRVHRTVNNNTSLAIITNIDINGLIVIPLNNFSISTDVTIRFSIKKCIKIE